VLLQRPGGRENEIAFAECALDLTGNWRQMQIGVGFKKFGTFELLTAHFALVKLRILDQGLFGGNWSLAGKQLFVGEAKNRHFEFSPSIDANAQVLLCCSFGWKLFEAYLAHVISDNCSHV